MWVGVRAFSEASAFGGSARRDYHHHRSIRLLHCAHMNSADCRSYGGSTGRDEAVDIVFLSEAYLRGQRELFFEDARRLIEDVFLGPKVRVRVRSGRV